jgi:hypothetical protein
LFDFWAALFPASRAVGRSPVAEVGRDVEDAVGTGRLVGDRTAAVGFVGTVRVDVRTGLLGGVARLRRRDP